MNIYLYGIANQKHWVCKSKIILPILIYKYTIYVFIIQIRGSSEMDLEIRINKTKCKKCLILNSQSLDWQKFSVFEEFRTIGGNTENTRNMRAYYGAETLWPSALEGKIPCLQKIGF